MNHGDPNQAMASVLVGLTYIIDVNQTWNEYNRQNANVNNNTWLNEIVDEMKESAEKHECYDKSVFFLVEH